MQRRRERAKIRRQAQAKQSKANGCWRKPASAVPVHPALRARAIEGAAQENNQGLYKEKAP